MPVSGREALEWLRNIFTGLIDCCSKIEFYGRLARAISRYQGQLAGGEENVASLLKTVLDDEAVMMWEEMNEGRFDYLVIASDGEIAYDMKERE